MPVSEQDMEEIAQQIRNGCTSGIIDGNETTHSVLGTELNVPYRISWSLDINKFET